MNQRIALFLLLLSPIFSFAQQELEKPDLAKLDQVFQRAGTILPGDVRKYSWPRSDLQVRVDQVVLDPAIGISSWAAFKNSSSEGQVMVMGDLALQPSEVNEVLTELRSGGIEILAIHNHLIGESPQVVYVHYVGHGDAKKLAGVIQETLARTKTPLTNLKNQPQTNESDSKVFQLIERILAKKGNVSGTVLQISVPRSERIEMDRQELPPSMGMANAMNFQVVGQRVATTGDLVLQADEVNSVIAELRGNGIEITALHSHMLHDTPRLFFMHFWALGDPGKVANGLKAALGKIGSVAQRESH